MFDLNAPLEGELLDRFGNGKNSLYGLCHFAGVENKAKDLHDNPRNIKKSRTDMEIKATF